MTEYFNSNGEALSAKLRVGAYDVIYFRRSVPDLILALFQGSQWTQTRTDTSMLDEPIYCYTLASPVKEVLARLAMYGIADAAFQSALADCRAELEAFVPRSKAGSWVTYIQCLAKIDSIEALAPLVSSRVDWNLNKMDAEQGAQPGSEEMLSTLHRRDPRLILYACATVAPTATAVLDLTDLVSAEGTEEWWIRPDGSDLCAAAVTRLSSRAGMPPVRVLTEGPTDTRFIEAAFNILRPDIADLVTFLNPQVKPQRGASALVEMVKQFSAAGVAHPVVALFDNDTAGQKEYERVPVPELRPNIKIATMPDIALAREYPTLPAPTDSSNSTQTEDVNRRACSIEMYFGFDVLAQKGILEPVQWSKSSGGQSPQGSFVNKKKIQDRYFDKVKQAQANPSVVAGQDWSGMRAIIEQIIEKTLQAVSSSDACAWQP